MPENYEALSVILAFMVLAGFIAIAFLTPPQ